MKKFIHTSLVPIIFFLTLITFDSTAQTLIADDAELEKVAVTNRKKGLKMFQGVTEKHTFTLQTKQSADQALTNVKKDERVLTAVYDQKKNAIVVTTTKNELRTAEYWLKPLVEIGSIKVKAHEMNYYKAE